MDTVERRYKSFGIMCEMGIEKNGKGQLDSKQKHMKKCSKCKNWMWHIGPTEGAENAPKSHRADCLEKDLEEEKNWYAE